MSFNRSKVGSVTNRFVDGKQFISVRSKLEASGVLKNFMDNL